MARVHPAQGVVLVMRLIAVVGLCCTGFALPQAHSRVKVAAVAQHGGSAAHSRTPRLTTLAGLPLRFDEIARGTQFLVHGAGYTLSLSRNDLVVTTTEGSTVASGTATTFSTRQKLSDRPEAVHLHFVGSSTTATVAGLDRLPGESNYLLGRDPRRWRVHVAGYARVAVHNLYRGIDVIYHAYSGRSHADNQIEYDLRVAPGADPRVFGLAVSGTMRAGIDRAGDLVIQTANGVIRQERPRAYQMDGQHGQAVSIAFVRQANGHIGFVIGRYDHRRDLIIDPTLVYSTYLGGRQTDQITSIAVDAAGDAYVSGNVMSPGASITGTALTLSCLGSGGCSTGINAFVSKLSPDGTQLVYSTYLGGAGGTIATGIAVDGSGNAYVTGSTTAADFPTTPLALQKSCHLLDAGYCTSAVVSKLSADGSTLLYSTFLGGSGSEIANGIALDSSGTAYIAGVTSSLDFPTTATAAQVTCHVSAYGECNSAFLSAVSADGSTLLYSSFLGGSGYQIATDVAADTIGGVYVTGYTNSLDFPTTPGAAQSSCRMYSGGGCPMTSFVAKIQPLVGNGSLVYSTYVGGSGDALANGIAVDASGAAYITGYTNATDFATTAGALQPTCPITQGACASGFVTKLTPDGHQFAFSSYLSGTNDGSSWVPAGSAGQAIAVSGGLVFVVGATTTTDFPVSADALQPTCTGNTGPTIPCKGTVFVEELRAGDGTAVYGTYFGGSSTDQGLAVSVDGSGAVYIAGQTNSTDFPVTASAVQATCAPLCADDGFVAKIALTASSSASTSTVTTVAGTPTAKASPAATTTAFPTGTPSATPTMTSTILPTPPNPLLLSSQPITENPAWQGYVVNDSGGLVYPISVTVLGNAAQVTNPLGLLSRGSAVTTLHPSSTGQVALLLDLGINTGGHVEVGITQGNGTPLVLAYSEAKRFMTSTGDGGTSPGGLDDDPDGRFDVITTTLTTTPMQFQSPGIRGAERWIMLYLEGSGSVSINYVRVRSTHYEPGLTDYSGHFLSNDYIVNRSWYAGAYTLSMDTIRDLRPGQNGNLVMADGAKRDRLIWTGDLPIEELTDFYTFANALRVSHDSVYAFACQQPSDGSVIPDIQIGIVCPPGNPGPSLPGNIYAGSGEYIAWYIVAAYSYYLYTGDSATLATLMPVLRRALTYLNNRTSGGLYLTRPTEFTWTASNPPGGEAANTNVVYYEALTDMAGLESAVAHNSTASQGDLQRAALVRQALLSQLWDSSAGAFRVSTTDPLADHPQDANVQAVVGGLLTGSQADSALTYVRQHLNGPFGSLTIDAANDAFMPQFVAPNIASWELWARFVRHDGANALNLLRREFGHMLGVDPNTTFWERMSTGGDVGQVPSGTNGAQPLGAGSVSMAHGWSTGPTSALSAWVLGIRPTAPGFAQWTIEPQLADLRWAQGQVSTPQGLLVSRWERGPGNDYFQLTAQSPVTSSGTIGVPLLGAGRTIAEDGAIVWQNGAPAPGVSAAQNGDYVEFSGVSGAHTFAWSTKTTVTPATPTTTPGSTATAAPTSRPTTMPTAMPTGSPSSTATLTATSTSSATATATPSSTMSSSPTPTATVRPTATNTATATPSALLAVSPISGTYGQTLTVSGTNFVINEPVALWWDSAYAQSVVITTTATGRFTYMPTVPALAFGSHILYAFGTRSSRLAGAVFSMKPQVYLSTTQAYAGTSDVLSGTGFGSRESVRAYWGGTTGPVLGATTTISSGDFAGTNALTVTLPLSATGTYVLVAVGQSSGAVAAQVVTLLPHSTLGGRQRAINPAHLSTCVAPGSNGRLTGRRHRILTARCRLPIRRYTSAGTDKVRHPRGG